jgi:hypothetical protein
MSAAKPPKKPTPTGGGTVKLLFPGLMSGMPFGQYLRQLAYCNFAIDPIFLPKAGLSVVSTMAVSAMGAVERLTRGREIDATKVPPPVFILGFWRSGTTMLHNLMATDPRFAYATTLHAFAPHLVFRSGRVLRLLNRLAGPKTRPMDNVSLDVDSPQEEEFALASACGYSPYTGLTWPRHADHYARYITFRGVPASHARRWQREVMYYYKRLTLRNGGKPLILKSPPHTGRVRLLAELFPDARFVHIHRNPFEVYQSNVKLMRSLVPLFQLQRAKPEQVGRAPRMVVTGYKETYEAFFEDRKHLKPGRYHEVSFEEVTRDPLTQVRQIYEKLELPDFETARPALEAYVATLAGYKKNKFRPMPEELRQELTREWAPCFAEWGYPTNPKPG